MTTPPPPLKFKVAPNIVQDLGLNLYTELPRVLAEFVANAYDADSPSAEVVIDAEGIRAAREAMRKAHTADLEKAKADGIAIHQVAPLANLTLPAQHAIIVSDTGFGMSRDELEKKFLFVGRRRRDEDPSPRTPTGRLIMGRKGLGKLAGFGVAKRIEVVTRKRGEPHATRITLVYDELIKRRNTDEIDIVDEKLTDGHGLPVSGTRITLSELLYDPTKSKEETISNELKEHFEFIKPGDFSVLLNGRLVEPRIPAFSFAWPHPEISVGSLVDAEFEDDDGNKVPFRYRMRFAQDDQALPAQRRGVRVYARGRLACAPSLLDADTNMHGFRMTDYLDGVVEADFIDSDTVSDFIATDRQSLRWDSPLLALLKDRLSSEITEACKQYQRTRDNRTSGVVKNDKFTLGKIDEFGLVGRNKTMAIRFGTILAKTCKRGVADPLYRKTFPPLLRGIGQGKLLATISALAKEKHPELDRVASEIANLVYEEMGAVVELAKGKIDAITALKKIVDDADFALKKEEKTVQKLLERAPWMVDATYGPPVGANVSMTTLFGNLAKALGIGRHAATSAGGGNDRPDLVFLLGTQSIGRCVVVELKAANVPLDSTHLDQLLDYMGFAEDWLEQNCPGQGFRVQGHLIGSVDWDGGGRSVRALRKRIKDAGPGTLWKVRSFVELLNETQQAHAELLEASKSFQLAPDDDDEDKEDEDGDEPDNDDDDD